MAKKIKAEIEPDYRSSVFSGLRDYLKGGIATLDGGTVWSTTSTSIEVSSTTTGTWGTAAVGSGWAPSIYTSRSTWPSVASAWSTTGWVPTWELTDAQRAMIVDVICEQIAIAPLLKGRTVSASRTSTGWSWSYSFDEK